jgi:hypothetical protein
MRALDLGDPSSGRPVVSGTAMDKRIEGFLRDVLALEGEHSNLVREGVRVLLANYERQFRNAETNKRMKDKAAHACHMLCRARVLEEMHRRKGTLTAVHLKIVLGVIDGPAIFPLKDE